MKPVEFVLWLKGLMAGAPKYQPNPEQWKVIRDTLEQVDLGDARIDPAATSITYLKNHTDVTYTTKQQLND